VREQAVGDGERGARKVGDGTTSGLSGEADDLVVRKYVVGEGQGAADVQDAAAQGRRPPERQAVGDRQPGDGDGHPTADAEDPALVVAAAGQPVAARAVGGQVIGGAQSSAGQGDGTV